MGGGGGSADWHGEPNGSSGESSTQQKEEKTVPNKDVKETGKELERERREERGKGRETESARVLIGEGEGGGETEMEDRG